MTKKYITFIFSILICVLYIVKTPVSITALSKIGTRGQEVINIQSKLKTWGYYKGNVDGIYGQNTANAVKAFQQKNGLTVDGVAGPQTLAKIGIPTTSAASSKETDVDILARIINGEARGETYTGQVAIGAVVLNRVRHPSFPNSVAGVIYQPGAFTAIDDGQINAAMTQSSVKAARDALNGWDPTKGAIYYYNPRTATNKWIRTRPVITTIGQHVFCK